MNKDFASIGRRKGDTFIPVRGVMSDDSASTAGPSHLYSKALQEAQKFALLSFGPFHILANSRVLQNVDFADQRLVAAAGGSILLFASFQY